jgi:opacity protein-like surface antigen
MTGVKAFLTGCCGALALAATAPLTAHAADMPADWPVENPKPQFSELLSGWYLRGDVGYRFNNVDAVQSFTPATSQRYPDSLGLTAGAGLKYQWFRADVTVDFGAPVRMRADTALGPSQYSTRVDAVSVLANAYIDLGTWAGFTPYVGAGVGASYLRSKDYSDASLPPSPLGSLVTHTTNFSWAWMVGVSYQIAPTWVVDVGYRHLDLGDIASTTGSGVVGDSTLWKNLSTDEVRVGVRMLLD